MKYLLIVLILLAGFFKTEAQMRMTTPEGKVVLLFDNGTWKYEEVKAEEIMIAAAVKSEEEISKPIVLKDIDLESIVVIKGESAKLAKFNSKKNTIKCNFQIISKNNKVVLKTEWKILEEEGFRFFGFITKKSKIDLELSNGEIVSLQYAKDFEPKEYPNYGFSIFSAELELNENQIRSLQKGYIKTSSMKWSRRLESYAVFDPDYFIKELPKIME
ncbi:hypothetical protein ACT3CE_04225 [Marinifilum sp. RC60d5]|uniref:hypothetical protein n=1 Tax=Marinifilum sp. RC60d5 TaxID=3458414 RepID=UPI0040358B9B